jgi:DNA-binding CsgD family transcriptional regulator
MITLLQICLSIYQVVILPQTQSWGSFGEALDIIPDVLMFLFLTVYGKRVSLIGAFRAFLALFICTVGVFLKFGYNARIPMQLLMEPAFRIADLLFVWVLVTVFYTYGRHQFRLKFCLTIFFVVRFGTLVGFDVLFSAAAPTAESAFFILLPVILAALLSPIAVRAHISMEARRAYAEEQQGPDVLLPPEREDVLAACEELTRTFLSDTALAADEQAALCYLIDGQDVDVVAYFMEIPVRRVRELIGDLLKKFGVNSNNDLMVKLGAMKSAANSREKREALFTRYGLTERERELTALLLSTEPAKNIAGIMGISQPTVSFHAKNIYSKLGVQSRAELAILFSAPATEHAGT